MRLLLAEDERALSKALTAILERNNYSVDAVYDGQSALDYLEADNYDGVVLDIMMPKVDGLTVLRKVRERGNLIPILLLTAKSEVDDKVEDWMPEQMIIWQNLFIQKNCWQESGQSQERRRHRQIPN